MGLKHWVGVISYEHKDVSFVYPILSKFLISPLKSDHNHRRKDERP